ncbi:carbohydrate ABC transporter permease [Aestuariivirga sp.]|jgi:multiple sugar transport system permease protein|uniref:carbohydrate ABC transporter permease n=1 Tax=Aestuariivirga sp. TaxID=2650926 RepID=UPI003784027C
MEMSRPLQLLRDTVAVLVTAIFMFPIFWWALTSIKPISAVFDKDRVNFFDFTPTFINYGVTLFGQSRSQIAIDEGLGMGVAGADAYDSRMSILESVIVSIGATAITMGVAVFAAYAISRMAFRGRASYLNWVLGQRFMPPIAILIPLVSIYKVAGMRDTDNLYMGYLGLMMIYALMNLPIAVLLMKSFFDDVPKDVDEAAMIDGATRWQTFRKVVLPMVKGGVAASAVLCFIFSWTEFLLSLFLTTDIRTVPVKIQTFVTSTGNEWGFIAALGTAAIIPSFIFILLVQKHLVRGLTLGSLKE